MSAILIYRSLSDQEILMIEQKARDGTNVFIADDIKIPLMLSEIKVEQITLNSDVQKATNYEVVKDLLAFGDTEVNGKTISDHLTIGDRSIWYYHKYRIQFAIRDKRYRELEIAQYEKEYGNVEVFTPRKNLNVSAESKLHYSAPNSSPNFNTLITFAWHFLRRALSGWSQASRLTKSKKHIIISTPKAVGSYLDLESLNTVKDDLYLGNLMQKGKGEFLFLDNMHVPKFISRENYEMNSNIGFENKRRERLNGEYLLLRGWMSGSVRKERKAHADQLQEAYTILKKSDLSPTHQDILDMIIGLDKTSRLFSLKYLSFRAFFKKHGYKTVTAQDETGAWTKLILDAAKDEGMATIGIQHGAINDLNIAYLFTQEDLTKPPMPDQTLVWGDHWKNMATTHGNYPEHSVKAIGQIRTDIIDKLKKSDRSTFSGKVPDGNSVLVFATQPQPDKALMKRATIDTFNAIKDIDKLTLVIKMHPRETDPNYYHTIARDLDCTNYIVDNSTDLYRVISAGDIMMTCYSVVGGEGIYFNKPLIILDHLKLDYCNFHEEKVAVQATNSEELKSFIVGFIDGSIKVDSVAYSKFISKYAHKIDGKVVDRCLEVIKSYE